MPAADRPNPSFLKTPMKAIAISRPITEAACLNSLWISYRLLAGNDEEVLDIGY